VAAFFQLVGQILGHYRILEQVGAGGMGVVYRAHDERLQRDVAIKILPLGTLVDEADRKRFRKEALALAQLNHPNISTVYDFDTQDSIDFLVMEYVQGTTLADKLRPGALPEKQIVAVGEQIAKALGRAHDTGIVHRDLKPGNIMITPAGDVKLLDFGLSVLLKSADDANLPETITAVKGLVGTLPYMAPEQVRGDLVDGRCDIYATGVVLYEMATGHRPFVARSSGGLIEEILHKLPAGPQIVNSRISPLLAEIILKCLEKDPDNRYQSAKELCVDLRRVAMVSSGVVPLTHPVTGAQHRGVLRPLIGIVVLLALLSAFIFGRWRGRSGESRSAHIRSLAVLPLDNISDDSSQEYFAQGMTEELTTKLAQISALRVISRTSVMQYKGTHKSLSDIAKELHVDAVVEGSVMRVGDRVRITAQLIEASTDRHLWAKDYDEPLQDVLRLQDQVAQAITREVKINLTPKEQERLASSRQVNSQAHEAYLKGRYHFNQGTEAHFHEATKYFEEAVRIDPNYALAYAGLADCYWATDELSPRVAMPKARDYVLKALAIDDGLAEAHATLATIKFYADWDWPGADQEFKYAIQLNPSFAEAHRMYSSFLMQMGRRDEASLQIRTAQELDPLSVATILTAGWMFYYARQYEQALQQCGKALQFANSASVHDCIGSAYLGKGDYQHAIAEFRVIESDPGSDPVRLVSLGRAYALSGRKSAAQKILKDLSTSSKVHYVPPYFFAMIEAALGNKDEAFASLEKAYNQRDTYLIRLKVDDALDGLRSDPRFERLLRRVGAW
jgi:eukaryotic-like serine/threonine-protein kinase